MFVLRLIEGLDVADTAAALDLGEEAVKTRLLPGRALLRRDLQRRAGIESAAIAWWRMVSSESAPEPGKMNP